MNNKILGFLSDLGDVDDAVATCKGMMQWISPNANIIDITHKVTPFDVQEGSWYLKDTTRYFPPHSVFCAFVWPTVGMACEALALRNEAGQLYVVPNNGLITHAHKQCPIVEAYQITSEDVMWMPLADTFLGRDIVAAASAHISNGVPIEEVGPKFDLANMVLLPDDPEPVATESDLVGIISLIDRNYGNVWTNVPESWVTDRFENARTYCVELNGHHIHLPINDVFHMVPKGEPLLYVNSRGNLALGLNQGSFAERYGIERGMEFRVRLNMPIPA